MNAIVLDRYGAPDEVMHLADVPTPTPGKGQVLVKQRASSINAADWHIVRADPWVARLMFGLTKPKKRVIGSDVAGVVEAVGEGVTRFKPGDEVMGDSFTGGLGAYAEYVLVEQDKMVLKPANVSFVQAGAVPLSGVTALQALTKYSSLQPGMRVLVNGAAGGVGHFAVQIAKHLGAHVTATCSAAKADVVGGLGADRVVDYMQEDITKSSEPFDVIFENALFRSINDYKLILKPGGTFLYVGGESSRFIPNMIASVFAGLTGAIKPVMFNVSATREDLERLADMLSSGAIVPHIDKTIPLAEVPQGIRFMEERKVKGKVAVEI